MKILLSLLLVVAIWAKGVASQIGQIFPQAKVITTDSLHFTIHRRFGNKPLALVHPMSA